MGKGSVIMILASKNCEVMSENIYVLFALIFTVKLVFHFLYRTALLLLPPNPVSVIVYFTSCQMAKIKWIQHDLWGEGKPLESEESSNGSDSRQSPVQIFCDSQSSAFLGLGLTLNPHPAVEPGQKEVVFALLNQTQTGTTLRLDSPQDYSFYLFIWLIFKILPHKDAVTFLGWIHVVLANQ